MALTPTQDGQTSPGRVDTDNASKQAFVKTIVSGTAFQISQTQNSNLYLDIATAASLAIAIGPTNACAVALNSAKTDSIGLLTVRVPTGWFVKVTGTPADFVATAVLD